MIGRSPRRDAAAPDPGRLDPVDELRSPEQVALQLPIAGPGSRVLAYALDYALIVLGEIALAALLFAATPVLGKLLEWTRPLFERSASLPDRAAAMHNAIMILIGVFIICQVMVELGYFFLAEMLTGGRSPGKRAVGLRVIGDDGLPLGTRASLVRNLLRVVDVLPGSYLVGLVAMMVSGRGQRLGDLAAGAIVIRLDRPFGALPAASAAADTAPQFRFSRAQLAALGLPERRLLRQAMRRLETLPTEQAARILEHTVEALRARLATDAVAPADRIAFLQALLRAIDMW